MVLFIYTVGTDWTKWVKVKANNIYDRVVQNRTSCSFENREVFDNDRRTVGEGWPLLTRPHMNMGIPTNDVVAPGNVFFYEED